jgi:predicted transposase/invertase (TIGR01784 family)
MKVAPLRYDVVFKKAFGDPELFTALAKDFLHIDALQIDKVENDKAFFPVVGNVNFKFDLFAEDKKNRVIIEMQHAHPTDSFERFLYYQCCAMVETIGNSKNYQFPVTVKTLVFFTQKANPSPDSGILTLDFQMRDSYNGKVIEKVFGKHKHQLVFVFTRESLYASSECEEWIQAIDDTLNGEVSPSSYDNPNIKKMFEKIRADKLTPEERAQMKEEYNQEEMQMTAREEGRAEGREKTACNLLALGTLSLEQIASVAELSVEKVRELSLREQA